MINNNDIAIVGMAGVFPDAQSIQEFYDNLKAGRDSVRAVSEQRLNATGVDKKEYKPFAYLNDVDRFDSAFFDILPGEARYMDPHQRLLMEVAYQALENGGYTDSDLKDKRVSIYLGDTDQQYYKLAQHNHPTLFTGNLNAVAAGRIARYFNFTGNATMVDTACSSSMVALYLGCNELRLGEANYVLVGGANVILFPPETYSDDETGIDSQDGKSRTFAAGASGTSNGEAVVWVLLKRLDAAVKDND
ncbi:MAG: polyketide synthase, partial [Flammeovirgaceae bacterium]